MSAIGFFVNQSQEENKREEVFFDRTAVFDCSAVGRV